jgi:peptidoglycan hydrolase-like protein with peptidoglycan-binding domain
MRRPAIGAGRTRRGAAARRPGLRRLLLPWLLAAAPAGFAEPVAWPAASWNPIPLPDDVVLPMPCGGAMAFRAVAVGPAPRALPEGGAVAGPLPLGPNGQGAYLLGKYELTRLQAAALRAFAQDTDCPTALDLEQVGPDQALRAAAADQRLPEARIAWAEARALANDYSAWLRLNAGAYPACASSASPAGTGPCIPRLDGEPAVARLPTEPEWEYAARGGQAVPAEAFGHPLPPPVASAFGRYAWSMDNARGDPEPIGTRQAGPLGLHDMFGNVSEIQHHSEPGARGEVFIARGGGYQSQPGQADSRYRDRFLLHDTRGRGRLSETGLRLGVGDSVYDLSQPGSCSPASEPGSKLAYLEVQTSVPARVRLNGAEVGYAGPERPLRLTDRLPGEHLLLAQADGHGLHSERLVLQAGTWTRVQAILEPLPERQEAGLSRADWSRIRSQLASLGHDPGHPGLWELITGRVSAATRASLRDFQAQQGLKPHGYAGDRTRAGLTEAIAAQVAEAKASRIAAEVRGRREREQVMRRAEAAATAASEARRQVEADAQRAAQDILALAPAASSRQTERAAPRADHGRAQAGEAGLSREQIAHVQTLLSDLGYDPGRTDGTMDGGTKTAIEHFEVARDLRRTGVPDADLLSRLERRHRFIFGAYADRHSEKVECAKTRVMSDPEYRACGLDPPSTR